MPNLSLCEEQYEGISIITLLRVEGGVELKPSSLKVESDCRNPMNVVQ